jgi:adenine-specific DNA-methyltransferase
MKKNTSKDSVRLVWDSKKTCKDESNQGNTQKYFVTPAKNSFSLTTASKSSCFIEGDCLDVLPLLQRDMKNAFRLIYIDPPYNTGKNFIYNDNFCSENWLDLMNEVLKSSLELLREDGLIFISIDDNQMHYLRCILDEIFGKEQFVQNFMWLHGKGKKDRFSRTMQQYILCYAKNKKKCVPWKIRVERHYDKLYNPDNDSRGDWFSGSISFQEKRSNPKHKNFFTITSPSGIKWTRQWLCSKEKMEEHLKDNCIYFGPHPSCSSVPRLKIFPPVFTDIIPPNMIENVGTTRSASKKLAELFDNVQVFDFPKPVELIQYLIEPILQDGDWMLDFFAGSGTTGQAVYECQKKNIDCKVVLVQKEEEISKDSLPQIVEYCENNKIKASISGICVQRLLRMSEPKIPFVFQQLSLSQ